MLNVNEKGATPLTGGRTAFPLAVPKRVLPLARVNVKSPFERVPVGGLRQ
jgi:hypothetical protein